MSTMRVLKLCIQHFGGINRFEASFTANCILLCGRNAETVLDAIGILTANQSITKRLKTEQISSEMLITAEIELSNTVFFVMASGNCGQFSLCAYRGLELCTENYLHNIIQSSEADATCCFFGEQSLSNLEDGRNVGVTQQLCDYRRGFIQNFVPEYLPNGKSHRLMVRDTGEFFVVDDVAEVPLSSSDKTLLQYLSFLQCSQFLDVLETFLDKQVISKPLLVSGLAERLDAAVSLDKLLLLGNKLNRQVVWAMPFKEDQKRIQQNNNVLQIQVE